MQLSKEATQILLEERVEHVDILTEASPVELSVSWTAELQAEEVGGAAVQMRRSGRTPDAALKSLFEGMHEAGIAL